MTIAHQRLVNSGLIKPLHASPAAVVGWHGAVQAQEYAGAKWALRLRLASFQEADFDRAFDDGEILRTHVMRPTWHFVAPTDIRWLIELTAPRVKALNATMDRKLEIDDDLFARSHNVITEALQGGNALTREELGAALGRAGIHAAGMRLGYLVHRAELDALVCSGGRRGKQFTYQLLDERAPNARSLPRDEALVTLVIRYFTSHGAATVDDFAWWSGLTKADTRHGIALAGSALISEVINGKTYWRGADSSADVSLTDRRAWLLPMFDEYTIAYADYSPIFDSRYADQADSMLLGGAIVIDGQVLGSWRRTLAKYTVTLEMRPFRVFSDEENALIAQAAAQFATYLGREIVLTGDQGSSGTGMKWKGTGEKDSR